MKSTKFRMFALATIFLAATLLSAPAASAANGVDLFTPYTHLTAPPGESIDYNIEVTNNTDAVVTVPVSATGLFEGWSHEINSGGWTIKEISVKPGDSETIRLDVEVPLDVQKGTYNFALDAGAYGRLPLTVEVSEQGSFKTELTTDQPNMEGHSETTFSYSLTLENKTAETQLYALSANMDRGWNVTFRVGGNQVSSVELDAGATETINVSAEPPVGITQGEYTIPVVASNANTSANIDLEAVVTGTYGIELTTPNGLLSTDITAGDDKRIQLVVKNTGTADLVNVDLSSSTPVDWEAEFQPDTIEQLPAGESSTVDLILTAADKAIAGDYVASFTASTPEASSTADFRVAVETSMLWGWIAVLLIAVVLGGVYYLFRVYGRR